MIKFIERIKNNRIIKAYMLISKDDPDNILTICLHKSEARMYAHMLLREKYLHHYENWCILHGYDVDSMTSWYIYFDEIVPDSEKEAYIITQVKYSYKNIAALMRMFAGCLPVGCDFEDEYEYDYAEAKLNMEKEYVELKEAYSKSDVAIGASNGK